MFIINPKYRLFDHDEKAMWDVSSIQWGEDRNISFIGVESDDVGVLEFSLSNDNISLMLDIGCKDKNGKLIYDFDVLKRTIDDLTLYSLVYFDTKILRYVESCIEFPSLRFWYEGMPVVEKETCGDEVIGNIFENKELKDIFSPHLVFLQNS